MRQALRAACIVAIVLASGAARAQLSGSHIKGRLQRGHPYFLEWKVTQDTLPASVLPAQILNQIGSAKDFSAGVGAEVNFFFTQTDGITLRWLQGIDGWNTDRGSPFFFFYNHILKI
jgi:hypothetical protein